MNSLDVKVVKTNSKAIAASLSAKARRDALSEYIAIGLKLVVPCCAIARHVRQRLGTDDSSTDTKADLSPVTTADLAIQTVVAHVLCSASKSHDAYFPVNLVGEEDIGSASQKLITTVQNVLYDQLPGSMLQELFDSYEAYDWNIDSIKKSFAHVSVKSSEHLESLMKTLPAGRRLFWVLDPIDGTKGFLRSDKGQYAMALALVDYDTGNPVLGILGCPHLPVKSGELNNPMSDRGVVMVAVLGGGSYAIALEALNQVTPLSQLLSKKCDIAKPQSTEDLVLVESVESGHTAHDVSARISVLLNLKQPSVRLDSQVKYALVARGEGSLFLRFPNPGYKECIWDHCAGAIVVSEAGGIVSHADNKPLVFRTTHLHNSSGIIALGADDSMLAHVIEAIESAKNDKQCLTAPL